MEPTFVPPSPPPVPYFGSVPDGIIRSNTDFLGWLSPPVTSPTEMTSVQKWALSGIIGILFLVLAYPSVRTVIDDALVRLKVGGEHTGLLVLASIMIAVVRLIL